MYHSSEQCDNGGGLTYAGVGVHGKTLYHLLNFVINLKLLYKLLSYKYWWDYVLSCQSLEYVLVFPSTQNSFKVTNLELCNATEKIKTQNKKNIHALWRRA